MKRIIAFTAAGLGLAVLLASGNALAQNFINETGTHTMGSRAFGFDPSNLIGAVTGAIDPNKCFICANPNAGGTTAGALTNSMFGEIRTNAEADQGDKSFDPAHQDMSIPGESGICGNNCNDASAFTFSLPLPVMNFLDTGMRVSPTNPAVTEPVGMNGAKMEFSNEFVYNADGSTTFNQTMKQTTFTGGGDFSADGTGNNGIQIVEFQADGVSPANNTGAGATSVVNWVQTIQDGGFSMGPLSGSFTYTPGDGNVPTGGSQPTGPGQSTGTGQ